jgi:cell division protein FtsL
VKIDYHLSVIFNVTLMIAWVVITVIFILSSIKYQDQLYNMTNEIYDLKNQLTNANIVITDYHNTLVDSHKLNKELQNYLIYCGIDIKNKECK